MQINLPTDPTQEPILVERSTTGSTERFLARNSSSELGFSTEPEMSDTTPERSRMFPLVSSSAGFSAPRFPKQSSSVISDSCPTRDSGRELWPADRVTWALDQLIEQRGQPEKVHSD